MERMNHEWHEREYVLNWAGTREEEGITSYREFVERGIGEGK